MITAVDDNDQVKLGALEAGATEFLNKPLKLYEFKARINNLRILRESQLMLQDRAIHLQEEVKKATAQIIEREFETLTIIGKASEYKDTETGNHIKRVSYYSKLLAENLYDDKDIVEGIFFGSPLHDVGKIGISDTILLKPGKLTDEEFAIMKSHTTIGSDMLQSANSKYLSFGAEIALTHHERWDGKGYPNGISGENIPLCGRVVAVADVFDALMSNRPYKAAWSFSDTSDYILENRGKQFAPRVVDAFRELKDEMHNILLRYEDKR
jgi:response regulator RpfG family c-di-GMP phosphodiesterase